jgi:hypothetical protein
LVQGQFCWDKEAKKILTEAIAYVEKNAQHRSGAYSYLANQAGFPEPLIILVQSFMSWQQETWHEQ